MLSLARRHFSRSSIGNGKKTIIKLKNVDIVKKSPAIMENDSFWQMQSDLKRGDLERFQDTFGADFKQAYTFIKNTDRLVASKTHTVYRPLDEKETANEFVYKGLFWTSPNVHFDQLATQQSHDAGYGIKNSMTCVTPKIATWHKEMSPSSEPVLKYYVSHYDFGDLRIPKNLEIEDIVVKNARDVPDVDILSYDAKHFKYERSKYVLSQLRHQEYGRVAYNSKGEVVGFGAITTHSDGECVLNPLYADEKLVAQAILANILEVLGMEKYWRLQVRSNDAFPDSYGWIRPFVKTMTHRHEVSHLVCDHNLVGMDFSKVYSNFHTSNGPM